MATSELSPAIVQDLCQRYSHQHITQQDGFEILSYSLKGANDAPAGFLGRHETLSVLIQKNRSDADAPQEVKFFIKSAPNDVASRAKYIEEFGVFKKEVCVYRYLLPKLQKGLSEFAPRCYYAKGNILVFEHLVEMGFRMGANRSGILDFEHLNCALNSLANLHAASMIFEDNNKKLIPHMFPETVQENAYPSVSDGVRIENFNNGVASVCEIIKIMPEYKDSNRLDYILKEFPLKMKRIFELCQPSNKFYNVFCHGDLWANNLLFKYEHGRPVQSRLVDFQLTRYAPPILDVITLLTIPTSKEFRSKHLDILLSNYFTMLGNILKQNGLQLSDYITQKQFEDSIRDFKICGLIESCLFSHLTILPTELTESLTTDTEGFEDFFNRKRNEICLRAFHIDEIYRRRLSDMISDIVDSYILN